GHAFGELDPKDPLNAIITDLQFAPRNSRGMVEYSATFLLVRPVDLSKTSGVLLYEVPNRGTSALARPPPMADYFKRGHVVLTRGWQGDLAAREGIETIGVPVAKNPDGSSITGRVFAEFSDMPNHATTLPIIMGRLPAPQVANLDTSKATLVRRTSDGGVATPLRSTDWAFADCTKTPFPGAPDPGKVCLKSGFDTAFRYELVY